MRAGAATVVDLAAYFGVTPARIRQVIAQHDVAPTGRRWKAKLYDPKDFLGFDIGHHHPKR